VTPSVTAAGYTNLSDATEVDRPIYTTVYP